jgi:hypothetical protein
MREKVSSVEHPPDRRKLNWYRLLNPLRYIISGGLIVYLVWQANPQAIWQAWKEVDGWLLALAFGLQLVGIAVSAAKWQLLLAAGGHRQPYRWLLAAYLVGQFANNFLPTTVGGDALRAIQLGRRIGSFSQASASVFLERLTGFLALSLIACIALLVSFATVTGAALVNDATMNVIAVSFTLLAAAAAAASFAARWLQQMFGHYLPDAAQRPMQRVAGALSDFFPQGRSFVLVMAMSLLFQSIWILVHVACGLALHVEAPLLLYAVMVPLSDILGLLPVFLNNVGAREIVFTLYLTQAGATQAEALALAFMVFSVRLLVSTLGGLVVLFGGADLRLSHRPPADTDASEAK